MMQGGPVNKLHHHNYRNSFFYLSILLAGLVIAYWPISFHVFSLKNDALNYFLPVRRLVSESYYHHILPLWSPYLNLGYPLHGDMQSGVWNPVVQLFSLFGPYTLYTLQLETLFYLYCSGAGMFFLLKHFQVHPYANLLASFAYMLCGFGSDSGQFLNWIAGIAFLPFVFLFYLRCLEEKTPRMAVYTGASVFLLYACAYPADFIITAYLMLAMFLWYFGNEYRNKTKITAVNKILYSHLIIIIVLLTLAAPSILSYTVSIPLSERGSGASYAAAMSNPLHPALIGAYTTPLAVWSMPGVSATDGLERNSYIGIIGFILTLCSFFFKTRSAIFQLCRYASLLFLLFSLGETGGIRILSYYALPLMDTFRHPANAKMFTTFFFCLLAALTFNMVIRNEVKEAVLKKGWYGAALLSLLLLAWASFNVMFSHSTLIPPSPPDGDQSVREMIKFYAERLNFSQLVVLNTLIQVPFFVLAWRFLIRKTNPLNLLVLSIANSILFCMMFQPFTVVKNKTASEIQKIVNSVTVDGYPLLNVDESLSSKSASGMLFFNEIGVSNLYNKKPGRVDYRITPWNLVSQNDFWAKKSYRQLIMDYPLIYQSDSALLENEISDLSALSAEKRYVFVDRVSLRDSINKFTSEKVSISMEKLNPNYFRFNIDCISPGYYVLLQNHFPLWCIKIDGNEMKPEKVNTSFMGFLLPKGNHIVEFEYKPVAVIAAFWISVVTLVSIALYILFGLLTLSRISGTRGTGKIVTI